MHESIFLNNLMNSTWKEYYEKLLFDINWLRYQENTNMQTINKIVSMVIKHCLQHLPTHLDERRKIFENMISLSGCKYKFNQFIENLPTYIPAGNSDLKFSWVKPSDVCRLILSNKSIMEQLTFQRVKYLN